MEFEHSNSIYIPEAQYVSLQNYMKIGQTVADNYNDLSFYQDGGSPAF